MRFCIFFFFSLMRLLDGFGLWAEVCWPLLFNMVSKQSESKSSWKFIVEIFYKMVYEKAPYSKEDLLTTIQSSWNHFDKEFCFKLVKLFKMVIFQHLFRYCKYFKCVTSACKNYTSCTLRECSLFFYFFI